MLSLSEGALVGVACLVVEWGGAVNGPSNQLGAPVGHCSLSHCR